MMDITQPKLATRMSATLGDRLRMIERVDSDERYETVALLCRTEELAALRAGWRFNWVEQSKTSEVFKLVVPDLPDQILGLIAFQRFAGRYVEVELLESSPDNIGVKKQYRGIAGSLLAFAAEVSIAVGADGFLAMTAKSELIVHYQTAYGFQRLGHTQRLILETLDAAELIRRFGGRTLDAPPTGT